MSIKNLIAVKYRIFPDENQKIDIRRNIQCSRAIYNMILYDKKKHYEENKEDIKLLVSHYKKLKGQEHLSLCDSLALMNAEQNLRTAYTNFFRGIQKNQKIGFPRFKKKETYGTYSTNNLVSKCNGKINNSIILFNKNNQDYINLPKNKNIKINIHRKIDGKIKQVTVRETLRGQFFVSILFEQNELSPQFEYYKQLNNIVGIDVGLRTYMTFSDSTDDINIEVNMINKMKKHEDRAIIYNKQMQRCIKNSRQYNEARIKKAKHNEKIVNIRQDFCHKLTNKIIKENQIIIIENLDIKNIMKQKHISKGFAEASFSTISTMLQYKAERRGRTLVKADKHFPSSQLCSTHGCNHRNKVTKTGVKKYICPECGIHHDRDINAAKNLSLYDEKLWKKFEHNINTKTKRKISWKEFKELRMIQIQESKLTI